MTEALQEKALNVALEAIEQLQIIVSSLSIRLMDLEGRIEGNGK